MKHFTCDLLDYENIGENTGKRFEMLLSYIYEKDHELIIFLLLGQYFRKSGSLFGSL